MYDRLHSLYGTNIAIKSGKVKLDYGIIMKWWGSCKCIPHLSKILTLTYNRPNSVIIIYLYKAMQYLSVTNETVKVYINHL